jgi:GH15 family glucan-1,4-alpha-glucosidase
MPALIEDYALIGDGHTAALVSRAGSIDWLCWPRFDSGACFAALLGTDKNGCWRIAPAAPASGSNADSNAAQVKTTRRYRGETLILETDFETPDGAVTLIDFMPPGNGWSELVRIVVGKRGTVRMDMQLTLRFDYGFSVPWVSQLTYESGIKAIVGPDTVVLRTPVELEGENMHTVASFDVREGERVPFSMSYAASHLRVPPPRDPFTALARTENFWCEWSSRSTVSGRWAEPIRRSLITLKALAYEPTGGIVAAPTTSLPEQLGGTRNWDYRYCWLRDATITLLAMMRGGHYDEAQAWRAWLGRVMAGSPEQLQIMYGIGGERRLPEFEVDWLAGYEGASPVRIGNNAVGQLQLDVYGEVMNALHLARIGGLQADDTAWSIQCTMLEHLEKIWNEPDEGIWETRGGRQHFTFSKVMAWVAYDRAIASAEKFGLPGPLDHWREVREQIHAAVCERSFNTELNTFTQTYDGTELDASLLLIPLVGFLPASDPRIAATVAAVERDLLCEGFVMRYRTTRFDDGLPPGEGTFLACSFWLVDNLALQGRVDDAQQMYERLLSLANDVGLLSEEYDPVARRLVGNFPQAFSHVALVNTGLNLMRHQQKIAEETGHPSGDGVDKDAAPRASQPG